MTERHRGRVLLIGMMGAGKSTTGRLLAERLGWPYRRQRRAGRGAAPARPCPRSARVRARRPSGPRSAEPSSQATTGDGPVVVGVAGGAVLDPDNRARIRAAGAGGVAAGRGGHAGRAGSARATDRPLLGSDPAAALARLYPERRPLYEELADLVVDVDQLTPDRGGRPHRGGPGAGDGGVRRCMRSTVGLGDRGLPGAGRRRRPPPPARGAAGRRPPGRHRDPGGDRRHGRRRRRAAHLLPRRRRGGQVPRVGRGAVPGLGPVGPDPGRRGGGRRRRAWSPTWPASPPPSTTGASPWSTCPPPCSARSTPPSAARPASTCPRARTWSAPSGSRPRCSATPTRWPPCRPREYRSGLGEMAKYAFLGRRGLAGPSARRRRGRLRARARPRWSAPTSGRGRRPAGPAQLRPHPGPRPRDRRRLRPAPRRGGRHRAGLRRPPGPPARPHRRPTGWPSTSGWSPATACRPGCRPASTPTR